MKRNMLLLAGLFLTFAVFGQTVGLNTVVQLNAIANGDGTITLKWPKASFTGSYKIYKNSSATPLAFSSSVATLTPADSTWKDATFAAGNKAEYAVARLNTSGQTTAIGYILAGNKTTETPSFGGMILVVDSNYIKPLSAELNTLQMDLQKGGWIVNTIYAGRKESVTAVKDRIKNVWQNAKPTPSTLYLLGHIPVPYSGNFSDLNNYPDACAYPPDGHIEGAGDHVGAWPADVYYGEFEGFWTDNIITNTRGTLTRHHNIPGDGKFDQCEAPGDIVLQIGRTDLFNMAFFNANDTALIKKYLDKVHLWRMDNIPYVNRGLVDDNFTSLDLSGTGYSILSSCVTLDSVFNNRDYFTYQNKGNYLWSYGCGAGSYTNCSGIGGNNYFNPNVFNNIFTALAGSFFGDWDATDCFLRAPLCNGSLISFWGGIPKWYGHYMGLGQPMGYSAMITQNVKTPSFNYSQNKVHIALMGDPTLTLKSVPPAGKLTATSTSGHIKLNWIAAKGNFDGYCIYRIDTTTNTWTRMNNAIITDTFYSDLATWQTGNYKYAVRPIRLESSGSGSYYNLGGGSYAWVSQTNGLPVFETLQMTLRPNPTAGILQVQMGTEITEGMEVTVADISGRSATIAWKKTGAGEITLDLSGYSDGIYFLKVAHSAGAGVSKFQVHH